MWCYQLHYEVEVTQLLRLARYGFDSRMRAINGRISVASMIMHLKKKQIHEFPEVCFTTNSVVRRKEEETLSWCKIVFSFEYM
ncbi:hypothetical protein DICVIV_01879 [Dictyocaulus viviparus]|uniref:Uncharacterized protein n=1 Tax=Dictyocaulus viviparus TaxID=29172 RepID=A0A0D8Y4W0_DICVI|nr:hypothetical protein DICVIV_01879 [Dictyocaulus viviparus]